MSKRKLSAKTFLLFVTYTAVVLISANTFDGLLSFGAFVGALYATNPIIVALVYLLSAILFGWDYLLQCAVRCGVMMLFVLIHHIAKRKISKVNLLFYVIIANLFYLVANFVGYFHLFDKILYTVCGVAFAFVSLYVFRALFVRGIAYPPALDERICICLFVVVVSYCLSQISMFNYQFVYFVVPFFVLFTYCAFDNVTSLVTASLFGLGNILATGEYGCFVFAILSGLVTLAFGKLSRYLSALGVVIVDVVMSYFLDLHGSFGALVFAPTLTSVFIFVVIPTRVYKYCNDCFSGSNVKYTGKSMSQKLMESLSVRLYRLSDIFLTIKNTFYALSVGQLSQKEIVDNMVKQCCEQVCQSCHMRTQCWRNHLKDTEQSFYMLSQSGLARGKCTILDVPQTLSVRCDRVAMLLSQVNSLAQTHKQFADNTQAKQSNKLLVADQMGGVSQLMLQLAKDYKRNISFDHTKEREMVESLVFHNVLCIDALFLTYANTLSVVVTVATNDIDNAVIEKCANIVTKQKMVVDKVESTDSLSWKKVYLRVKPRFQVTFGVSHVAKNGSQVSADTHSQIFTDNGKCIIALCDGMGSGQKAEQMSTTVTNLVESFYRAGFDSDMILTAINQLLTQSGNEIFCAMDMVVLDLYNGFADFIKLGATIGLVKNCGTVELIAGSSLPLGVLEEMKPSITQKALAGGDMIVLMSDGIVDCYKNHQAVAEVFCNATYTTPQSVAETILAKTLKLCSSTPPDDMTVVVAKII